MVCLQTNTNCVAKTIRRKNYVQIFVDVDHSMPSSTCVAADLGARSAHSFKLCIAARSGRSLFHFVCLVSVSNPGFLRKFHPKNLIQARPLKFHFNPHSFRNTLVQLGQEVCKSPEEFKAWSQNLGHEKVLTTFLSYGEVACHRQGEIIRTLATPQQATQSDVTELAKAIAREMRSNGM